MPDKLIYEYAIIRVVPKVERGEFINVGVILFSKRTRYLKMKYHVDGKKLQALSDEIDIDLIEKYLTAWEHVCEGREGGGPIGQLEIHVRFRWLTASRSTIIQSSKVHPGLCNDLDKLLEHLYSKFVL